SIIIKRQIPSLSRRQLYRCDEAFCNEINAYNHIVPLLDRYMPDTIFPKCFYAGHDGKGEIIVLEDLKEEGFRMQNRIKGLELNHCEIVMKQLAKLHAASIAAKQLDNEMFRDKCKQVREIVYCKEAEEFYRNILETSIEESLDSLRTSNSDGCLTEPIKLIEKLQYKLFGKIQNSISNPTDHMSVMCHGDLWVNNIMFTTTNADCKEFDEEAYNGTNAINTTKSLPRDVRFFDLQAMRYTSLVFDILHFIYTSTKRDLRDAYTKHLLETYSVELSATLEKQFIHSIRDLDSLRNTYSLHNITEEYYKHVLYGLAVCMWILPAVTFDPNNIPNLDAISEMNSSAKKIKCTQKLTPEYHSRLKDLALEFYQNGYFNLSLIED
uniref:CHK kinase-like domain-containing protein n=2 Tax=Stomoxys calcitrans TaxID=35570 RepID=A0A1I8P5Y5_STOCA